ncbi:hypothetical protein [Zavarzinella formosa]|uniref:hypothetical protein n=1 Tax=Zavarzinella formosa TaxID=360055 RepID=UPI00037F1981|nr:hypothetical protein [Zavarzinella formosa]
MTKLGLTTLAAAMLATGQLVPEGMGFPLSQPRQTKQFTVFDQERLDRAEAKRERRLARNLAVAKETL